MNALCFIPRENRRHDDRRTWTTEVKRCFGVFAHGECVYVDKDVYLGSLTSCCLGPGLFRSTRHPLKMPVGLFGGTTHPPSGKIPFYPGRCPSLSRRNIHCGRWRVGATCFLPIKPLLALLLVEVGSSLAANLPDRVSLYD